MADYLPQGRLAVAELIVGTSITYPGGGTGGGTPVATVNGQSGPTVTLDAGDVGAVALTGDQTVGGVKTFSASPVVPAPDDGPEAANKNYVDAQIIIVNQTLDARLSPAARTAINALTAIATADATDPATTMALANECKAKINALTAALKA